MFSVVFEALKERGFMLLPRMPHGAGYSRDDFFADLLAGVTVAAVLIPQSIAYALLAGLPPAHGLYAAFVGGIAGSLWGSSRFLATGPIAIASLLTMSAVAPLAIPGSTTYALLVAALALMVGFIQIVFGFARLGFLVRLVPHSVLIGFSSGAAFVIILSQIPHFFGIASSTGTIALEQALHIVTNVSGVNTATLLVGALSLAALVALRAMHRAIPGNLVVLLLGIAASYAFDFPALGVALSGDIPSQLPLSDIPSVSLSQLLSLTGNALILALVGFMSAYATVKEFSQKARDHMHADQELIGQGFANVFSGLFRGIPVGGSLSRTAVNYDAGARTPWAGIYASCAVITVMVFFSSVLSHLPTAVLAAILIFAVVPLVDIAGLRRTDAISRTDGAIGLATFGAALFFRPDQAVLFGVILALVLYMQKVMWVHVKEVGFHPQWLALVSKDLFPHAEVFPGMLMLRIDAPIFYANIERLALEVDARLREYRGAHGRPPKVVALDFSGVNHMDVTGVEGFGDIVSDLHEQHIGIWVITPRRGAREVMERGHIAEHVRFVHGTRELRLFGEALKHTARGTGNQKDDSPPGAGKHGYGYAQ